MKCKNCEYTLKDSHKFCPNCGAKIIYDRLTVKNLWSDFSERFLNYDNSLFKTIRHMFTKPEVVIDSYVQGTRKKYLNVFNYFAVAITITGFITFISLKLFPEVYKDGMNFYSTFQDSEIQKKAVSDSIAKLFEYQSLFYFLTIPILALMSKIVFYNYKKYNYTEHAIIYLYSYSHTLVIINILYIITIIVNKELFPYLTLLAIPFSVIYIAYVLKRLFSLTLLQTILKTLLFILVGSVFYIVIIIIIGIIMLTVMFFDGSLMEMVEEQRRLKGK